MRKFYKPLSVLLALSMCVSMIAPALADACYEEKNDPGYDIQNHPDYTPAEVEGVLDNKEPEKDDSISAVIDVIMDKVDQQAIDDTNEAAKVLTDTATENEQKATEEANKADKLADALDQIIDAVTEVPVVDAEAATKDESVTDKDNNPVTNEKGEEVEVLDVKIEEKSDGTQVPTVKVEVEVTTDEKGETVTEQKAIDQFASEKATAVETAKTEAETAATSAQNALTAAQTAVSSRDQAALDTAKNQAADAYAAANEAAKTAAETYAVAEKVVNDAQEAYNDAVAKLEAAGYKLEDIKGQLEAAQKAVTDAQDALKSAAAAKAEAEKQRDYAMLYSSLAEAITSDYTYTEEEYKNGIPLSEEAFKLFSDALTKLDEAAKKYGTIDSSTKEGEDKLEYLADILVSGVYVAGGAREDYLQWLNSDEGKKFMEAYTAKKNEIEKWEIEDKNLNNFFPGPDGKNSFWKNENGEDIPLGDGDLIYKMYFLSIQDAVVGNKATQALPTESAYYVKQLREGLEKYLEAEEVLKKVEAGEKVQITMGGQTGIYSKDGITDTNGNPILTPENCEEKTGLTWEAYSAMLCGQLQSEMSKQMGDAYKEVFVDKTAGTTLYEKLKTFDAITMPEELHTLVTYMGLMEYELQFREKNMEYGAAWDWYKGTVDGTDVVNFLLSGYNWGTSELKKNLEAELAQQQAQGKVDPVLKQLVEDLNAGKPNNEYGIKVLLAYKGMLEDPSIKETDPEVSSVYNVVVEHAKAKLEEAQKAAKAADDAVKAYDDAVKAAEDAQKRLDELLKNGNLSAIESAKNRLENAQNALAEAEANRDAALAAQQQAEANYNTAMRLVIADSGSGSGTGTTTGGTGTGGDGGGSGISIEDQAVPLAGLVSRAEFLDYLWRHEGSPAADAPDFPDVPADHDFAQAIGWGQANRLVVGYPDGNFYPDETVTVQMVRIILGCFSDVFGTNAVAAADLTTLTGEDGDVVFNCAEVLAEFFGEEYVSAANGEDDIDVDVAA